MPDLIIREILEQHASALILFARQWCESPEDCLQEVIIRVSRKNQVPENWLPWVYRIVKNEAISQRRKSNRRFKHESNASEQRPSWFEAPSNSRTDGEYDAEDVTRALQMLDEKKREVITAKLWGGLTFEQIAELSRCAVSTVHDRYRAALSKLKKILAGKLDPSRSSNETTPSEDRSKQVVPGVSGTGAPGKKENEISRNRPAPTVW